MSPRSSEPTPSQTSWIVTVRPFTCPARIGPLQRTTAGLSMRPSAINAAGTVLSQPTMHTRASKSCACDISSMESAITSREINDARIPGVACDWLSETAIVLNGRGTPPAAVMPAATRADRSRWFRLHGIVPVHADAMPTIGSLSRAGSMPIARKCARAPARSAPVASASRARRRNASCVTGRPYASGTAPRRRPSYRMRPTSRGACRGPSRRRPGRRTPRDARRARARTRVRRGAGTER